jgi:hypothetical protein
LTIWVCWRTTVGVTASSAISFVAAGPRILPGYVTSMSADGTAMRRRTLARGPSDGRFGASCRECSGWIGAVRRPVAEHSDGAGHAPLLPSQVDSISKPCGVSMDLAALNRQVSATGVSRQSGLVSTLPQQILVILPSIRGQGPRLRLPVRESRLQQFQRQRNQRDSGEHTDARRVHAVRKEVRHRPLLLSRAVCCESAWAVADFVPLRRSVPGCT